MSTSSPSGPVTGFDFALYIIEHKGNQAVEILLDASNDGKESDWLEKKAGVYRVESKDDEYRKALEKCRPEEIKQAKKDLNNELLANIATAIVSIHNTRGGVLLIGIDDKTNEPVSFADNDGGEIWMNGKEEYVRKAIRDRLFRGNNKFKCPNKESWEIPTKKINVITQWCPYKEAEILALIIPPLPKEKNPLEIKRLKDGFESRFVPHRLYGDVGRVEKDEIKSVAQLADFKEQRKDFLDKRYDLSVKLEELVEVEIPSSVIPPVVAENFFGRDKELEKLHSLLSDERIPVVTGPGGVGKSELVLQYADRHKEDYHGGLFQIDMGTVKSWDEAFRLLLKTDREDMWSLLGLHKPYGNNSDENEERLPSAKEIAGALVRRAKRDGRILLVLDNIESVEDFFGESIFERKAALPPEVRIVATACKSNIALGQNQNARCVELNLAVLSTSASLELLCSNHPAETDAEQKAAAKIAEDLCGIPLYLCRIRALLTGRPIPFARSYADLETKLRKGLLETVGTAMDKADESERKPDILWNLTRKALSSDPYGTACINLAHMASFFSTDGFGVHVLRYLWDELIAPNAEAGCTFEGAFEVLKWHWILSRDGDNLRMHRLNAEALRRSAREDDPEIEDEVGKVLAKTSETTTDDWISLAGSLSALRHIPRTMRNGYLCVNILLRNAAFAEMCPWDNLDGFSWEQLLEKLPQFADKCPWWKLEGEDWAQLLEMQPQFACKCPWEKLDERDFMDLTGWAWLLREQPDRFANKCPWEILDGGDWSFLLRKQPQFAIMCPWEKLDGGEWALLLAQQPQFANWRSWKSPDRNRWASLMVNLLQFVSRFPWRKLEGIHWAQLLANQPQFANKCPWRKLDGASWALLLANQPDKFVDKCRWEKLDGNHWALLLANQPQFANKCPWEKLGYGAWTLLLGKQPQFAEHPERCSWEELGGYEWAWLLERRPQFADRCLWDKLDGNDWASLLTKQPRFADRCTWEKLEYKDWEVLLLNQPQFAGKRPWKTLGGGDWERLLIKQPQFADICQWGKLGGGDWAGVLVHQPQFADKCPWEKFEGYDWAWLLEKRPEFASKCQWNKLQGNDWASLLCDQPQFADKCQWEKLDGGDWERLLKCRPNFLDKCNWERLSVYDWTTLLRDRPELAAKCPWDKLEGNDWASLLCDQPQFAEHCPWEKLDGHDWARLLESQPQFARKCPWEKLDGHDWARLLESQPQFARKCPWEKLDGHDWARLLGRQPQLARKCPWEKLGERDLMGLTGWAQLLESQPQFARKCPWKELDGHNWEYLVGRQPQFARKCPWEKLDGHDWAQLLGWRPQFANQCPRDKLAGYDWASLLVKQPVFAEQCPWDKLEGNDWAKLLRDQPQFADKCPWEKLDDNDWRDLLRWQSQFAKYRVSTPPRG